MDKPNYFSELEKRLSEVGPVRKDKFPVTKQAIDTVKRVMVEQDIYGYNKYKKALDHKDRYNWLDMFLQEQADGIKYIQCEMNRQKDVVRLLSRAYEADDTFSKNALILEALDLLTIEGTGK